VFAATDYNTMFKYNSGRKQESSVWKYFQHDPSTDKSTCTVDSCNAVLKGKNASNLKTHLNSKHKEIAAILIESDKEKDKNKSTQQLKVITLNVLCFSYTFTPTPVLHLFSYTCRLHYTFGMCYLFT